MVSPLQRQRDAILARNAGGAPQPASVNTDSLHLHLAEFEQDKSALKSFAQIAEKVNYKRDVLIPKYRPLAEQYIESGECYQNPVFTDMVIWLFDTDELDTAISWCLTAIERGLPSPERFNRNWPTICADFVLEWSENQFDNGQSVEPYFSQIFERIDDAWNVPEKLAAKWYKLAGYMLIANDDGEPQPSHIGNLEQLQRAESLLLKAHEKHNKIGVKTQIDRIRMRMNALTDGTNL
ncbi:terminase endonuclease subunit [Vibrio quintilis]|uniref:Phage small terminase subunit n=1 Tax=Vibrio quintilis TaxID=1117707 RepID=A0A1M7YZ70_9VIBR|nr:terminase endonuclease subunit [Vibrio quintilis]SHO57884.1 Phage small terminase subunit [Vibrio quintilis]